MIDKEFLNKYKDTVRSYDSKVLKFFEKNPHFAAGTNGMLAASLVFPDLSVNDILTILIKHNKITKAFDLVSSRYIIEPKMALSKRLPKTGEKFKNIVRDNVDVNSLEWVDKVLSRYTYDIFRVINMTEHYKDVLTTPRLISGQYVEHNDIKLYSMIYNLMNENMSVKKISDEIGIEYRLVERILSENKIYNAKNYQVPPLAVDIARRMAFHSMLSYIHAFGFSKINIWHSHDVVIDHGIGAKLPRVKQIYKLGSKNCNITKLPDISVEIHKDRNISYSSTIKNLTSLESTAVFAKLANLFHANNKFNITSDQSRIDRLMKSDFISSAQVMELMCHYGGMEEVKDYLVSYNNVLRVIKASPLNMTTGHCAMHMDNWGMYKAAVEEVHRCPIPNTNDINVLMRSCKAKTILDPCACYLTTALWCKKNGVQYRWIECTDAFETMMSNIYPNETWYKKYDGKENIDMVVDINKFPLQWMVDTLPTNVKCAQLHKNSQHLKEVIDGHTVQTARDSLTGCTWVTFTVKK